MAVFGKHCLYLIVFCLVFSAILRLNLFEILLPLIPLYFLVLLFRITTIRVKNPSEVTISQLGKPDILLNPPFQINNWWIYEQQKDIVTRGIITGVKKKSNRQNIVISNVQVTDIHQEQINFVEKMVYGFRSPSESRYQNKVVDTTKTTFHIYRTDKLINFLRDNNLCS